MRELWISAAMLSGAFGLFLAAGTNREAPLVGHDRLESMASLEAVVATHPEQEEHLAELCGAYLDRQAPGLAIAAIRRAPAALQQSPRMLNLWSKALLREGEASLALRRSREAIDGCERQGCAPWVLANAMRHERFLSAMVSMGVEDYQVNPAAAQIAYQKIGYTVAALEQ